jgi:hypothetical protein
MDVAITGQQRSKHVSSATNQHATTELLEAVFSVWSMPC